MTTATGRDAALAMLRERFPESEGWWFRCWVDGFMLRWVQARNGQAVCVSDASTDGYSAAACTLIASWDAATHAEQVRALVEAAEKAVPFAACAEECVTYKYGSDTCDCGCESATRAARAALAALPASLRGKGGGRG